MSNVLKNNKKLPVEPSVLVFQRGALILNRPAYEFLGSPDWVVLSLDGPLKLPATIRMRAAGPADEYRFRLGKNGVGQRRVSMCSTLFDLGWRPAKSYHADVSCDEETKSLVIEIPAQKNLYLV